MRRAEILLRYGDAAATSGMKPGEKIRFRVGRNRSGRLHEKNWRPAVIRNRGNPE
jgi:hypothetical protein